MPQLDEEAQRLHDLLGNRPPVSTLTPEEARAQSRARRAMVAHPLEHVARVADRVVAGPHGELGLRVYTPASQSDGPLAGVVFFHGGGWTVGDLDGHDALCRQIANRVVAVVVSVDYHLAPENPYPVAVDEAVAAVSFVIAHAAELGVDSRRVAVAGDSSGGNLAAASCIRRRDEGERVLAAQLLIYPVTQGEVDPSRYDASLSTAFLTPEGMAWYCEQYLGHDTGSAEAPDASPLLAPSLDDLPPAIVVSAEVDILAPQASAYCARLRADGVTVVELGYPGVFHGFLNMTGVLASARQALEDCTRALRSALSAPG